MKKLTALVLTGSILTTLVTSVFAAGAPTMPPTLQSENNNGLPTFGNCTPNRNSCNFFNLQPESSGQAVYFYCSKPNGLTSFKMHNGWVMITGFDENGRLEADASYLDQHYFAAYKDPRGRISTGFLFIDQDNKATIRCESYTPTPTEARTIAPGPAR